MQLNPNHALVVLSGGQDSTTCLFKAVRDYADVSAISFDYGQAHNCELNAARIVAQMAGVTQHRVVYLPKGLLVSTSPLTNYGRGLEKYESAKQMEEAVGDRIESTFVPMRNALFLTIAANYAVAIGAGELVLGICEADNANYPDCTDVFRTSAERYCNEALGMNQNTGPYLKIRAPLMGLNKAETCQLAFTMAKAGRKEGYTAWSRVWEALAFTHTGYDGAYPPTDMNHANVLRADGFEKAGLPDPLVLRAVKEGRMSLPTTANYHAPLRQP